MEVSTGCVVTLHGQDEVVVIHCAHGLDAQAITNKHSRARSLTINTVGHQEIPSAFIYNFVKVIEKTANFRRSREASRSGFQLKEVKGQS